MCHNSEVIDRFRRFFNSIEPDTLQDLATVYSPDVHFLDPFTEIKGRDALGEYLRNAYCNVLCCHFEFGISFGSNDQQALPWVMNLKHQKLARGQLVQVPGMSHLAVLGDRIVFHRDYFDAGRLLYENIPILGPAVRFLRRHAT